MRSRILLWLILAVSQGVFAQEIQNISVQRVGNLILVKYDLIASEGEKYRVDLKSAHDNFQNSLKAVSGDVGEDVIPGNNKQIAWNFTSELPSDFNGEISFKIEARLIALPFRFISPAEGYRLKRGSKTNALWQGGKTDQQVKFELYQAGQLIQNLGQTGNTGNFEFTIPRKTKPGSYNLRLSSDGQQLLSPGFTIKLKIPWALKIPVTLAIGTGVAILLSSGKEKSQPITYLPQPIKPN